MASGRMYLRILTRGPMSWIVFVGLLTTSLLALLAGSPEFCAVALTLLVVWALAHVHFPWLPGVSVLLLVLLFVPSKIYALPVSLPFDLDLYRLVLLFLALMWLVSVFVLRGGHVSRTHLDTAIVVFLVAVAASYVANAPLFAPTSEFRLMAKWTAYVVSFPLTFYLISSVVRTSEDALRLLDLLVLGAGVAGIFALVERATDFNLFMHLNAFVPFLKVVGSSELVHGAVFRSGLRTAGPTAHPIAFAAMMSMILPLSLARSLEAESRRFRIVASACSALIAVAIFLCISRTGVIGMVVGGLVLFVSLPRYRGLLLSALAALVFFVHSFFRGLVGTLVLWLTPSFILSAEKGNQLGRLADYGAALPDILSRPLFGRGYNTYGPDRYVLNWIDNQYLKFALEIGIVGVACYLYLMWRAISVPLKVGIGAGGQKGTVLIGISAAAGVFATTSLTFDTFGFPQVVYLLFALSALGAVIVNEVTGNAQR